MYIIDNICYSFQHNNPIIILLIIIYVHYKCTFYHLIFFCKKTINTYLKLEIRDVCRECLAFKYVFIVFFQNKSDDHLYLYIRNLKNSRLKPVFQYTISICICVGSEKILIVLSKNGVKCAVFMISIFVSLFVWIKYVIR